MKTGYQSVQRGYLGRCFWTQP